MTCELTMSDAAYIALGAVGLAVIAPGDWHDIALDAARQRWGVGPGGTATEEETDETDTDEDQ